MATGTGTQGPPGDAEQGRKLLGKQRFDEWYARYSRLQQLIEEQKLVVEATPTPQTEAALEDLMDRFERVEDRLNTIVKRFDIYKYAQNEGFIAESYPDERGKNPGGTGDDGGSGAGTGTGEGKIAGKVDDASPDPDPKPKNNDVLTGDPNDDRLPGKRGKDYHLVRYGGEVYAVYSINFQGQTLKVSWRIDEKDYERMGVGSGDGVRITKEQFQRIQMFGNARDVTRKNSGNIHPLKKFLKGLAEQYPDASWLRDKEYMGIIIMGFQEGWDKTAIANRLRETKWYQSRTVEERQWEQVYTDADREGKRKATRLQMTEYLDQIYGPLVNWRTYVSQDKLDEMVEKVASGKWGPQSLATWQTKAFRDAKKIKDTAAWQEEQDQLSEANQKKNRPEDVQEQLRAESIQWLGYRHRPDRSTLKRWADDIVTGKKSMADWQQFLRQTKKHLFPYLDPDEPWQDRAMVYKNAAEELLGTTLTWDDKLLSDLTLKKEDGTPVSNAVMSAFDFEKMVRKDDRFLGSKRAREEGYAVLSEFTRMFTGSEA